MNAIPAELGLFSAIGVAIVSAAVLAVLFNRLKQPALLAYIAAGLLLGVFAAPILGESRHGLEEVSHLGLVFLLFIIGLELNLKGIFQLGPRVGAAVFLQMPIAAAVTWCLLFVLDQAAVALPGLPQARGAWIYIAIASALGSTAVVVKLLADKFDLYSEAGKITVLTLIAQDLWAVLSLSYVSSLGPSPSGDRPNMLFVFFGVALLGVLLFLFARYTLSRIMAFLARSPDLIALAGLGWCFACAGAVSWLGLSAEMGALLAGVSIAALPSASELLSKVSSLRDFFMALSFVTLGMSLPPPTLDILLGSLILVALVVASRLFLFAPTLLLSGPGPIVSFASAANLMQLSEFSLLIVPIGVAQGVLTGQEASVVSYGLMLSVVLSSYVIRHNYRIASLLARVVKPDKGSPRGESAPAPKTAAGHAGPPAEILILGYFHNAESLANRLKTDAPHLIPKIRVVYFNLKNHARIRAHGLRVVYGDISNPATLRHFGAPEAKVLVSTISDSFLRGTSNARLLAMARSMNPGARVICTQDSQAGAEMLQRDGAFLCVCPPETAAGDYVQAMLKGLAAAEQPKA